MDEDDTEKSQQVAVWHTAYRKGTDFDLWGQPLEASDSYQRLAAHLRLEGAAEATLFSDEQKSPGQIAEINLEDVKKVDSILKDLLSSSSKDFPLDVSSPSVQAQLKASGSEISTGYEQGTLEASTSGFVFDNGEDYEVGPDPYARGGTLLSPLEPVPGKTVLTIRIEKIGLKEAAQYIDPYISILVKDFNGVELTQSQDTPVAVQKEETYIFFGTDVHIQKPIEMLAYGFGIYFEFKHYKPKKKTYSTKCWSFLEKDEVKEGPIAIELYKKPMDIRRKKIHLLTVKPLYLHLKLTFNA